MTDKNKPQDDLSIEEILGSIRRIIGEDEDEPTNASKDEASAKPAHAVTNDSYAEEEEEPLELTDKIDSDGMIVSATPVVEEEPAPFVADEIELAEPETEVEEIPNIAFEEKIILMEEPVPMSAPATPQDDEPLPTDAILSSSTAEATSAVMAKLARHTALMENGGGAVGNGATIESIVREMLKPMLRDWLDQNLPDMVQKMVEREIERLTKHL